tara:strand:+ start:834 stop:1175 length:342 start_codon:yes stop_codon:yes gene_type:complete
MLYIDGPLMAFLKSISVGERCHVIVEWRDSGHQYDHPHRLHFSDPNHTAKAPVIAPVTVAVSAVACDVIASGGSDINHSMTRIYIKVITNIITLGRILQAKNRSIVTSIIVFL